MNTILNNSWGSNFVEYAIRRRSIKCFYDFLGVESHKCNLIIMQNGSFSASYGRQETTSGVMHDD
jgi:hypothetical protein